ncbi:hypothetical protein ACO2J1_05390 [Leptospira interrogans]|uniref:hypothetical protein n=1 Tax=Leptospira interrogans TaxID=173 RepID=UPI000292A14E|nr:hypothetical protein [Leptospira interrogans]EKO71196.1 hypothetical protein LEP1GSC069_0212 [Leptospira interrogans serovar Canicola str. Fiocruz LV133]EMK20419.1 hypothetical protein LEP1GSC075_2527 [Leptospira interrogans str. Kito]EMN75644.1 hypothetical protein LEP1GSC102_0896 [Leptospira interrogans str. UI 09600]MCH5433510.1 hypothetical protein [Leptospira interrogans serovar Canicola]MCR8625912.1 hypothetical protein [Leptospira interrogans serovar Canicola]
MKKRIILILFGISVFCNLLFVYQVFKKFSKPEAIATKPDCRKEVEDKREFYSVVRILPHPPDFLEGRSLRFLSYTTRKENGRKWILFKEKISNGQKETKVDAEAVRWF